MSKEHQRALTEQEIKDLLRPHGNVDKTYILLEDGTKHYITGKLPDAVAGSFQGRAGQVRKYTPGMITAYKPKGGEQ
jgi:hypothetical protein